MELLYKVEPCVEVLHVAPPGAISTGLVYRVCQQLAAGRPLLLVLPQQLAASRLLLLVLPQQLAESRLLLLALLVLEIARPLLRVLPQQRSGCKPLGGGLWGLWGTERMQETKARTPMPLAARGEVVESCMVAAANCLRNDALQENPCCGNHCAHF